MVPRRLLTILVYALPLLVVAFGVFMGGSALAHATQDAAAARVLRWIAMSCLMLLVIDLVLLVGALGVNALAFPASHPDPHSPPNSPPSPRRGNEP